MAKKRLPNPGQDAGVWGQILNDYLSVSHDESGSIWIANDDADRDTKIPSPSEGQIVINKSSGQIQRYTGSSWENVTKSANADNLGTAAFKNVGSNPGDVVAISDTGTLPLPTGASTEATLVQSRDVLVNINGKDFATEATLANINAKQPSLGTAGTPSSNVITVQGVTSMTPLQVTTQTGLATEAKQPSLGVAGTPSANVLTVQGIAAMTPLTTSQDRGIATTTVAFSGATTSATFTLANRLALIVVPIIAGSPTLTLQVTLDGGTTWVSSSVVVVASDTNPVVIEADKISKVSGACGLTNAFRFLASTSLTGVTLQVRSIVQ